MRELTFHSSIDVSHQNYHAAEFSNFGYRPRGPEGKDSVTKRGLRLWVMWAERTSKRGEAWEHVDVKWSSCRRLFSHHKDILCVFRVPCRPPLLLPAFDRPRFLWHISNDLHFIKRRPTYLNIIPSKLNSVKSRIIKHLLSSFQVGFAVFSVVQTLDNWQFLLHLPPHYQP